MTHATRLLAQISLWRACVAVLHWQYPHRGCGESRTSKGCNHETPLTPRDICEACSFFSHIACTNFHCEPHHLVLQSSFATISMWGCSVQLERTSPIADPPPRVSWQTGNNRFRGSTPEPTRDTHQHHTPQRNHGCSQRAFASTCCNVSLCRACCLQNAALVCA